MKAAELDFKLRDIFERAVVAFPPEISEHTFTNIFVWQRTRPIRMIEAKESVILLAGHPNTPVLFGPPIGPMSLSEIFKFLHSEGIEIQAMLRIPEKNIAHPFPEHWEIFEDRDNFDYIYRQSDLSELSGRKYHAKRNLIAQCLEQYHCDYEEITQSNISEVAQMMDLWCAHRGCSKTPSLCNEYIAIRELFAHFGELNILGSAIRIDGKIVAFSIGEKLNTNTAVIHFEKALPEYKGLYQLINQLFCQKQLSAFDFVNREQDLGIEGLKKAKESYFPDHLIKKFTLTLKGKTPPNIELPDLERCSN